jgi:hypothetical protein
MPSPTGKGGPYKIERAKKSQKELAILEKRLRERG